MPIAGDTAIHLSPPIPSVPFGPLVDAWRQVDFDPQASAAALDAWLKRFAVPPGWFRSGEVLDDGPVATDELLFLDPPPERDWDWIMFAAAEESRFSTRIPRSFVEKAALITRSLNGFENAGEFIAAFGTDLDAPVRSAIAAALSRRTDYGTWPDQMGRGIHRREHASIAMSDSRSVVLFDPQGYRGVWTTASKYPAERSPCVDAVVITHGHADHWHLPSVLRHCDANTQVIVPHVPRVNLLAPVNFPATLTAVGQKHTCLQWGRKTRVGDIEIEALPYGGERPTGSPYDADDGLRIWGNCYAVRCAHFSALVMVDAGVDSSGEMRDRVRDLVARDGRFDVVLCGYGSQTLGAWSPVFSLAVPFGHLRKRHEELARDVRERLNVRVARIAEICAIAQARYVLPYAHGFNGLEEPISFDGGRVREPALMLMLDAELRHVGAPAQISNWWVGNRFPIGDFVLPG